MDPGIVAGVIAKALLSALSTRVLKRAWDWLLGSPTERAVGGAVQAALLTTIRSQAPAATDAHVARIAEVLDEHWPDFDFSPDGTGTLLESLEFMVSTALTSASEPIDIAAGYQPTSTLDAIRDEAGVTLDALSFGRTFIDHVINRLSRMAISEPAVRTLIEQLKQDQAYRLLRADTVVPAMFGVEFLIFRAAMPGTLVTMDNLWIGFINRGNRLASQVTFRFSAHAEYLDGTFIDDDSAEYGQATQVPPGDDTTFRVLQELWNRSRRLELPGFEFALRLAVQYGSDDELLSPRPMTVEITPTFLDGVHPHPRVGPKVRAQMTWSRQDTRFALSYSSQVIDPLGPAIAGR